MGAIGIAEALPVAPVHRGNGIVNTDHYLRQNVPDRKKKEWQNYGKRKPRNKSRKPIR